MTIWTTGLLEKMIVALLVKKFQDFLEIRVFIIVFIRALPSTSPEPDESSRPSIQFS